MARLNPRQRIVFSRVVEACGAGISIAALLAKVSKLLRSAIGAEAFCSSQLDPVTGLLMDAVTDGWPDEAKPLLLDKVLLRTPAADPYLLFRQGHRAVDVRTLLKHAECIERERYFEFHLLPFGYAHELQCMCSADGSPQALLTFSRSAARGTFDPEDLRVLSVAAPHIGKAVRRIEMLTLREASPGNASGVILVRADGGIAYASEVAREWLAASNADQAWRLGLQLAVKLATGERRQHDMLDEIVVRSPDKGDLYRLRLDEGPAPEGTAALFLEPARPADAVNTLRRLGLSSREADVALNLVRGLDVESISASLGCSPHTINQHKKQVFDKLAVSSRFQLACALLGPAPA